MTATWAPATELERRLAVALLTGDAVGFVHRLAAAEILLPVTDGRLWPPVPVGGRPCVPVFTSPAAMAVGTRGHAEDHATLPYRELAACWPDPANSMLLDPLTPLQVELTAPELVRVAWEPVLEGGSVLQQVLTAEQAGRLLADGGTTVSGYAVRLEEVGYAVERDTVDVLAGRLPLDVLEPALGPAPREVYALRWPAVAGQRYRNAQPGTGFLPRALPAVQLYRVDAVPLPAGTELVRIDGTAPSALLARYDGRTWTPC